VLPGGNVYVVDPANGVLEEFGALGEWEGAVLSLPGVSPWIAINQTADLEEGDVYAAVPASGVVDRIRPGLLMVEGQIKGLSEPSGVAVNSTGDVFVSETTAGKVLEFNAIGEPVDATGKLNSANTVLEGLNAPQALVTDSSGDLYIATGEGTVEYTLTAGVYTKVEPPLDGGASGVTVTPAGDVLVDRGSEFADYQSGALVGTGGSGILGGGGRGIAASSAATHRVYVANSEAAVIDLFEEGPTPQTPTTTAGEALGTNLIFKGTLGADSTGYYFEYNTGGTCEGGPTTGPEAGAPGAVSSQVSLEPATLYTYCLVATSPYGTAIGNPVSLETGSVPAEISNQSFSNVGPHGGTLTAQVNPENLPGAYYYTYGTPGTFKTTPKTTSEVSYEKTPFNAEAELSGLEPNTEYQFQLTVTNTHSETAKGPISTLITLPVTPAGLPDNRAYEMVTPVENHNADVYVPRAEPVLTTNGTPDLQPFQVSPEGTAITYVADPTVGGFGSTGSEFGNQYLAKRSPEDGWTQTNIEPAGRKATEYQGFSSDLSTGILFSGAEPPPRLEPLSPEAPSEGYRVLYACDESQSACTAPEETQVTPQNPFQPLFVGPLSRLAEEFGTQGFGRRGLGVVHNGKVSPAPVFAGTASSAAAGLLFEANDALLSGSGRTEKELAASVNSEIASEEDSNYLYDSVGGALSLVDVLPAGNVASDATFGGTPFPGNDFDPPDFSNVVSRDGSRVYWTDLHNGVVYLRVGGTSTVQVSGGAGAARYWTSAAGGRYAFYTEVEGESEGLFRFDAETQTRDQLIAPTAHVLGMIGSSEDGSSVYFVAEGVLSGENSAGISPQAGQPNLYLQRDGGEPIFIATLSLQDGIAIEPFHSSRNESRGEYGDWQPALSNRTAEVSDNGDSVVFMSSSSLPVVGFPNGYPTGGADEVYLFDAGTHRLFCVSCSSSGEPGGSAGFLPISWTDTYIPQWVSEDGDRVFFNSSAPLVPQDINSHQDVYEWEREGTGGCTTGSGVNGGCISLLSGGTSNANSWFVGASANGNDVFVVTRAQLVPEDQNGAYDLYDVRVDGTRPVSSPACTGSGCQGVPAPPPIFATPSSMTAEGIGNLPPSTPSSSKSLTRAQKLTRALKVCKKAAKRKRRACEASARKRYGPVKAKKKRANGKKKAKGKMAGVGHVIEGGR
jgi:hypothetical protein